MIRDAAPCRLLPGAGTTHRGMAATRSSPWSSPVACTGTAHRPGRAQTFPTSRRLAVPPPRDTGGSGDPGWVEGRYPHRLALRRHCALDGDPLARWHIGHGSVRLESPCVPIPASGIRTALKAVRVYARAIAIVWGTPRRCAGACESSRGGQARDGAGPPGPAKTDAAKFHARYRRRSLTLKGPWRLVPADGAYGA